LSTDAFLDRKTMEAALARTGYARVKTGAWTFIPKGDMPAPIAGALTGLDLLGRIPGLRGLRGGLWACAWRGE
jgi:hypothetical protein